MGYGTNVIPSKRKKSHRFHIFYSCCFQTLVICGGFSPTHAIISHNLFLEICFSVINIFSHVHLSVLWVCIFHIWSHSHHVIGSMCKFRKWFSNVIANINTHLSLCNKHPVWLHELSDFFLCHDIWRHYHETWSVSQYLWLKKKGKNSHVYKSQVIVREM